MTIKLKIQACADRERMILALANSGYKVWTEEERDNLLNSTYYVVFETENQ
jgi:hypothetical protein